jgi:hypothetical protein
VRASCVSLYLWPLAYLTALVSIFYSPYLRSGTVQWDGVDVHYSSQRYLADALHAGHLPFWTPYIFFGFPFVADPQVGAWYPLNWPFLAAGLSPNMIAGELLLNALVACSGAYVLAARFFRQRTAAMVVAILYGLSGYFAAHSQHVGMVQTAAWMPWLLVALEALAERFSARRVVFTVFVGGALALPGHFQTALYAFTAAGAWILLTGLTGRTWSTTRRRAVGLLVAAFGGALLSAVMILPGLELVSQSLRTRLDTPSVDVGYFQPEALLTLVQPDHFGLLSNHYVGPHDITQHYFYAGIGLVPLAIVGLWRGPARSMALCIALPFVCYAAGPEAGLFRVLAPLPGFHSIDLPMNGWFLPTLGLAILAGAGFHRVQPRLRWPVLGVLLVTLMFVDVFEFNVRQNPLAFARQSFDELYGAPLDAFAAEVNETQPPVDRLYGPPMTAIGYRNHALQSRVESSYGYNPLELARYADYVDAAAANPRLVDGLSATYRLQVRDMSTLTIAANEHALPLAYFARHVSSLPNDRAALALLPQLDPAEKTLVVNPPPALQSDPAATATVVERADDRFVIHYRTSVPNLLRVAIPWFPGWQASSNGTELETLPADYALLGIVVPPGEGDVQLTYRPRWFLIGGLTSGLTLLALLAVLVGSLRPSRAPG